MTFFNSVKLSMFALVCNSAFALAGSLPDPKTCGAEFKEPVTFEHQGVGFFSSGLTFTTTLKFASSAFNFASDYGVDIEGETVDGNKMSDNWRTGGLQKFALAFDTELDCSKRDDFKHCALSAYENLRRLNDAREGLLSSAKSLSGKTERHALACATSIVLSFAFKSMRYADLGRDLVEDEKGLARLDSTQIAAVTSRIESIKAEKDADDAVTFSIINSINTSSSSR